MQNWNNVIQYIKANIGIKATNLEFNDEELIEYLKNHTLPAFSNYQPRRLWASVKSVDPTIDTSIYLSPWIYQIDNPNNEVIIDVVAIYRDKYNSLLQSRYYYTNPVDIVMANTISTIVEHLKPINTFEFIHPDLLKFDSNPFFGNDFVIAEIYVQHKDLFYIPRDMYEKLFKLMALADVLNLIISTRNTFTNVTTPFGQIDLNVDFLQQKLDNINQKIEDIIMYKPHRDYLIFV